MTEVAELPYRLITAAKAAYGEFVRLNFEEPT